MKEHIENLMVPSENKIDLFPLLCIFMLLSKAGCTAFKKMQTKIFY